MKVSVCIPVYNAELFIEQTIKSVLNQTYKDFELIICDNQSTDNTVQIIKKFNDARINLCINDENIGMFGNWNLCLKKATGEYIHILCADDYLEPTALEKEVELLDSNPNMSFVFNASNVIDENNKVMFKSKAFKKSQILDGRKAARKSFRKKNMFGEPSNVMMRKRASDVIGEFCPEVLYSADWDYWLRMCTIGSVGYISEPLTNFRVSKGTGTSELMHQLDKLKLDDKKLVERVKQNSKISVTTYDVISHVCLIRFRTLLKIVFSAFVN